MAKVLAIDYGTKNVGLAISDELGIIAKRLEILYNKSDEETVEKIAEIVENDRVETIVIGVPLDENGEDTEMSIRVKEFKNLLSNRLPNAKFVEWNEFFSSQVSKAGPAGELGWLKRQEDSEVARMLLQEYLDSVGN